VGVGRARIAHEQLAHPRLAVLEAATDERLHFFREAASRDLGVVATEDALRRPAEELFRATVDVHVAAVGTDRGHGFLHAVEQARLEAESLLELAAPGVVADHGGGANDGAIARTHRSDRDGGRELTAILALAQRFEG